MELVAKYDTRGISIRFEKLNDYEFIVVMTDQNETTKAHLQKAYIASLPPQAFAKRGGIRLPHVYTYTQALQRYMKWVKMIKNPKIELCRYTH